MSPLDDLIDAWIAARLAGDEALAAELLAMAGDPAAVAALLADLPPA